MQALYVIKVGGNVIDDPSLRASFVKDLASVEGLKIIIHGGGKIATRIGDQMGITSHYVQGRRITDADTIDLVTMVYGGLVNKQLVAQLQAHGCQAIGLTGADANIIPASKRPVGAIDYGFVGDVSTDRLGVEALGALLTANLTPVFAPLTHDGQGQILNTNADTIASSIAIALSKQYAVRLIYCFEKKGVLQDPENEDSVIPSIQKASMAAMIADGTLTAGIIPKLENAFAAIEQGVKEVLIGHAKDIRINTTTQVVGTLIH